MLNEIEVNKIFSTKYPSLKISDIHWRSQDSDSNSILFYKSMNDEKSLKLFQERIVSSKYSLLITNQSLSFLPQNSVIVEEHRWPEIQKKILDQLYPLPKLKLMALTGTNGKTTTTDLVLQLGEMAGKKGLSIGTLGVRENNKTLVDFGLTSPSFIDLRKFLAKYGKDKDFCVLEASSHALLQERIFGLEFDGAGWLSFTQDHLDYHQTMEAYFEAKSLIFKQLKPAAKLFVPLEQSDLYKSLAKYPALSIAKTIDEKLPLFFQTKFNKNNLEVALAIVESVFGNLQKPDFNSLHSPDGRFYIKPFGSSYIVVDFAHTPDALMNVCQGIKTAFPLHKLKVLFGCGGDRDRNKRPKMAAVVDELADYIYVTSDNPRSENPEQIINDILQGIQKNTPTVMVERPAAVQLAFTEIKDNEILLLAGKGHEDYILINGIKNYYSDIEEVDKFLARTQK